MCDSRGVIYAGREEGMNEFKVQYAVPTHARTLADALQDADVFIGLSVPNCVSKEMVRSMARDPIIFAMANPDPEITWEAVQDARSDVIFGTGRSDYPNQVNNVLGFPFIFRGALDVRARAINMEMKMAAARSLAALAKEDVPDEVITRLRPGNARVRPRLHHPKPLDPRVLMHVAPAVAQAAMESGVARMHIDMDEYLNQLAGPHGHERAVHAHHGTKGAARSRSASSSPKENTPRSFAPPTRWNPTASASRSCSVSQEEIDAERNALGLHYEPLVIDPNSSPDRASRTRRRSTNAASARASRSASPTTCSASPTTSAP